MGVGMGYLKYTGATLLALTGFLPVGEVWARQNIIIGEMSIGYDFQDRNYKQADTVANSREGDTRNIFASPRVRFSSRDVSDLLEFTYAPTFTYDDVDSSDFVGHDFSLLAEKNISRDWLVRATNSYFYGQDSVSDNQGQRSAIIPSQEVPQPNPAPGAAQPTGEPRQLSDVYGRQQYWRNDFGLRTDYTYAQDSVVGVGYNYGVLRNSNKDVVSGESDYDRHEGFGSLSYRFNTQWQAMTEVSYVKGLYDDKAFSNVTDIANEDLEEYHGMVRANYSWRPHDVFFGKYSYAETVYKDETLQNSTIHEFTVGWDHDFSQRLRMTLSGGPSIVTFEDSDNETGYNAYAGLIWNVQHAATLSAHTSYGYEYDNFDGRQIGLSKKWSSGVEYLYQFTPQLQTSLSAGYERSDSGDQLNGVIAANNSNQLNGTEKTYDAGLTVRYGFLRYYTLAASYRYADYTAPGDEYDEHRVLVTLTAAQEIFRW
jgi:hypothetical protein